MLKKISFFPADFSADEVFFFVLLLFFLVPVCHRLFMLFFFLPSENILSAVSLFYTYMLFFRGILFDALTVCLFIVPAQLFVFYNYRAACHILAFSAAEGCLFFAWLVFFHADYVFFAVFGRHIGNEIFSAGENFRFLLGQAFSVHISFTVFAFIAALFLSFAIFRFLSVLKEKKDNKYVFPSVNSRNFLLRKYFAVLAWPVCFFIFICFNKPILNYSYDNSDIAKYSVSPVFSAAAAAKKNVLKRKLFFPGEQSRRLSLSYLYSQNEELSDNENIFLRRRKKFYSPDKKNKAAKLNFVIFFLESFNPEPLLKNLDAVPEMNRIRKEGLYFPQFFSSGVRSRIGLNSLLYSVPAVPGIPVSGRIYGKNIFQPFAEYFKKEGYDTLYAQTGHFSDGLKSAAHSGFDYIFSRKDLFENNKENNADNEEHGMDMFLDKIDKIYEKKPFLGIYYTSVPHYPYFQNFPNGDSDKTQNDETLYMRVLGYVDSCISGFMRKAEHKSWFDNTVFVFVPDHRGHLKSDFDRSIHTSRDDFLSFLILYSPKNIKPGEDYGYAGQEDILPTLLDLAGYEGNYLSAGNSVLDKSLIRNKRFVYSENGAFYAFYDDGIFSVKTDKIKPEDIKKADMRIQEIIAFEEAAYSAIYDGKWQLH